MTGSLSVAEIKDLTVVGNVTGSIDADRILVNATKAGLLIEGDVATGGSILVDEMVDPVSGNVSKLEVEGDVRGTIHIGRMGIDAELRVLDDVFGSITVTGDFDRATMRIEGDIATGATVTLNAFLSYGHLQLATSSGSVIAGRLVLNQGIPENANMVQIPGAMTAGGTIDLTGDAVVGTLKVLGGGSGSIVNGGNLSGEVLLASGSADFDGEATFQDVSGLLAVGSLSSDAADLGGSLFVEGALTGNVWVTGNMDDSGRIIISGSCSGDILVGDTMADLAQINLKSSLAAGGLVDVNADGGASSVTGGTIWVGGRVGTPLSAVTFDGTVRVNCSATPGTFDGLIRVVGCHATTDALDICVLGTNSGTITITQTGCANQVAASCTSGSCP